MPTVFNEKGFRFFFSNKEDRMRVHVHNADGEISDFKIDKFGNLRWEDLDIDIERDALRHSE